MDRIEPSLMNRLVKSWRGLFKRVDPVVTGWMARHAIGLIRTGDTVQYANLILESA